ncbi:hypothetical protein [Clostridioides difficile]|uniref:hypothetical protein n=1 Tax=Clostridioides difficile TaxID=1496 RepID=UPI000D1EC42A|nr:hypothetical protein [Clostridioides difficile]HBE9444512.1 hypothetical protein [Clostridioides difficile]
MKNNKIIALKYLIYNNKIIGYRVKFKNNIYDISKVLWDKYKTKKYANRNESNSIELHLVNGLLMSTKEIKNNKKYIELKDESKIKMLVEVYDSNINRWSQEDEARLKLYAEKLTLDEVMTLISNYSEESIKDKLKEFGLNLKRN